MKPQDKIVLTKEQLAENPAVDPKIVKDALKMRQELERLGVWENCGRMVRSPSDIRPALNPFRNARRRFITQLK